MEQRDQPSDVHSDPQRFIDQVPRGARQVTRSEIHVAGGPDNGGTVIDVARADDPPQYGPLYVNEPLRWNTPRQTDLLPDGHERPSSSQGGSEPNSSLSLSLAELEERIRAVWQERFDRLEQQVADLAHQQQCTTLREAQRTALFRHWSR